MVQYLLMCIPLFENRTHEGQLVLQVKPKISDNIWSDNQITSLIGQYLKHYKKII